DELVRSQLWKRVYSAFTYGDVLVTMGTGKISNRAERETGLAGEHDYAILDMKEVGDQKLFLIKNPWCEGTSWRGSITKPTAEIDGDATAQSTHELLNVHAELTPGTFWMDLNNVIQHF
ncbi:cysteine protease, partial [Cryomyces antarcticus]